MSNTQSPLVFIANMMNMTLATGIFTLPFSLYEGGIILGTIILIVICFISWVTSTYILEAIAITNCIYRSEYNLIKSSNNNDTEISDTSLKTLQSNQKFSYKVSDNRESSASESEESQDNYYISKRFEVANIGNRNMPFILYLLLAIDICLYLYIGLTSNTVIASRSIQKIFSIMIYGDTHSLPSYYYYIIACSFIFIVLLLSLGDIKNLRKFTIAIMICRFSVIVIILSCCFYSMAEYGVSSFDQIPKFKIENISIMLGNSIFFFMIHHSIPGIVDSFKPQKKLSFLLFIGFLISLIFMISFGFIALLAFSKVTTCDNDFFPCAIQDSFSLNFISLPIIGYIINLYPLFNLITSAMQLITLKNNIIQITESLGSKMLSFLYSEKNFVYYLKQFVLSLTVALPPIIVSLTLTDIQQIMKYFSSIFGFFLMIFFPCVLIIFSRKRMNEVNLDPGNINRSIFKNNSFVYVIFSAAAVIAGLIIYGFFHKDTKTCVAQDIN